VAKLSTGEADDLDLHGVFQGINILVQ